MCDDFRRKVNHILLQVSAFLGWLGAKPFRFRKVHDYYPIYFKIPTEKEYFQSKEATKM